MRARVGALPNVEIVGECEVIDLVASGARDRVTGVRVLRSAAGGDRNEEDAPSRPTWSSTPPAAPAARPAWLPAPRLRPGSRRAGERADQVLNPGPAVAPGCPWRQEAGHCRLVARLPAGPGDDRCRRRPLDRHAVRLPRASSASRSRRFPGLYVVGRPTRRARGDPRGRAARRHRRLPLSGEPETALRAAAPVPRPGPPGLWRCDLRFQPRLRPGHIGRRAASRGTARCTSRRRPRAGAAVLPGRSQAGSTPPGSWPSAPIYPCLEWKDRGRFRPG